MCLGRNSEIIISIIVSRQENIVDKLTVYPSPSSQRHIYEGVCLENAYIGHFMFIGVVIIQDRKALNAFYVLMSEMVGETLLSYQPDSILAIFTAWQQNCSDLFSSFNTFDFDY